MLFPEIRLESVLQLLDCDLTLIPHSSMLVTFSYAYALHSSIRVDPTTARLSQGTKAPMSGKILADTGRNGDFHYFRPQLDWTLFTSHPYHNTRNRSVVRTLRNTARQSRILTIPRSLHNQSQWLSSSSSAAPSRATPAGSLPLPPLSRSKSL